MDTQSSVVELWDEKTRVIWEAYWRNPEDGKVLSQLVEHYLPLVYKVLERMSIALPSHVDIQDLLQAASLGLYHALSRFDPEQGHEFESFAYPRIKGAILDELRSMDTISRTNRTKVKKIESAIRDWAQEHGAPPNAEELAQVVDMEVDDLNQLIVSAQPWLSLESTLVSSGEGSVSLKDILADSSIPRPDREVEREDLRNHLRRAFLRISNREQKILYLYYFEELRLSEIAVLYNLTEARICQIHALAVAKLKAIMSAEQ